MATSGVISGSVSKVGPRTSNSADTPLLTPVEAPQAASKNAQLAQDGGDPRPSKYRFPTVAKTLATERDAPAWGHPALTAANWRNVLRRRASAVLALRVDEVTDADCTDVLAPLRNTKRERGARPSGASPPSSSAP